MRVLPFLLVAVVAALAAFAAQNDRLDAAGLKKMLEGMGYELKTLSAEAGKEKWEFTVTKDDLDVFIGAELSASKNYIWLTVFFKPDVTESTSAANLHALLMANARVQPAHFYISSSNQLMMGFPIDNRSVTPAVLRRAIDSLTSGVVSTEDIWGGE